PLPATLMAVAIFEASVAPVAEVTNVPVPAPVLALAPPAVITSVVVPFDAVIVNVVAVELFATVIWLIAGTRPPGAATPVTFVPVTTKSLAQLAVVTSKLYLAGYMPAPALALPPMKLLQSRVTTSCRRRNGPRKKLVFTALRRTYCWT